MTSKMLSRESYGLSHSFEWVKNLTLSPRQMKVADLSISKEQLGYVPEYDLHAALMDYVEWYKRHLDR